MSLEAGKAKGKEEEATYHSVSAFGLSTGTLMGISGMSILKVVAELEDGLEISSENTRRDN